MSRSIGRIYVEEAVARHPRTLEVLARFPKAERVPCRRYGEVFNPKAQSFRLQKRKPALILAEKFDRFVLPVPPGYGVGGDRGFYFSHLLNCIYDCRYCFLQGMFRSAAYVLFVNYEEMQEAIAATVAERPGEETWFFSGYDCDSLALEPVTGFAREFVPFVDRLPGARLELRTKSVQIGALLDLDPVESCVVAWSFTPEKVRRALEHGVPAVERRIAAMARLAERGWKLGLRFDPLIHHPGFEESYRELFEDVFTRLPPESIHSVSLGPFRLPKGFYDTLYRLYPEEKLLAGPLATRDGMVSYREDLEREMTELCVAELRRLVPPAKLFPISEPGPIEVGGAPGLPLSPPADRPRAIAVE